MSTDPELASKVAEASSENTNGSGMGWNFGFDRAARTVRVTSNHGFVFEKTLTKEEAEVDILVLREKFFDSFIDRVVTEKQRTRALRAEALIEKEGL